MHIKCRQSGLAPEAIVIVATVRALKMHGGVALDQLTQTDTAALSCGLENLAAHLDSAAQFGRPVIVAINRFTNDHPDELARVHEFCQARGIPCATADVFGQGGDGATTLVETVLVLAAKNGPATADALSSARSRRNQAHHHRHENLWRRGRAVHRCRAEPVLLTFARNGFDQLPLCMAKTQNSLSDDGKETRPAPRLPYHGA